jgi:hypothetical protein
MSLRSYRLSLTKSNSFVFLHQIESMNKTMLLSLGLVSPHNDLLIDIIESNKNDFTFILKKLTVVKELALLV